MAVVLGWRNLIEQAATIRGVLNVSTPFDVAAVMTPQLAHASPVAASGVGSLMKIHVDFGVQMAGLRLFVLALPKTGVRPLSASFMRVWLDTTVENGNGVLNTSADTGAILADGYWVYLHPTDLTGRHLTWRFQWDATVEPTFDVGRVYAGPALVTARGVTDLVRETLEADVTERTGLGGIRQSVAGQRFRRTEFTAPSLTLAEATSVTQCADEAGTTGQVFVSPWADSRASMSSDGFFGRFRSIPEPVGTARAGRYSCRFDVEEDL